MTQQLNLYRQLNQREVMPFSADHIAAAMVLTFILLCLYSLFAFFLSSNSAKDIAGLEQKRGTMTAELIALQRKTDSQLPVEINHLKRALVAKRRLLDSLDNGPKEYAGFSQQMVGLGRQHQTGLWLDHIHLTGNGKQLALKGVMQEASLLPKYLQALRAEPVFSGVQFDLLKIEELENERQLKFEIGLTSITSSKES